MDAAARLAGERVPVKRMTSGDVIEAGRHFLIVTLEVSLPILLAGLIAGVLVSIFQAATQIQEFTLTFVPKLLAVILALALFGSWILATLVNYVVTTFTRMPPVTR